VNIENPSPPKASATVLICRDSKDGLEVFMVKRHHQIDFASGAFVFPGGKLEAADGNPELQNYATGLDAGDPLFAYKVAAIREAYEESGVLFAREAGTENFISPQRLAAMTAQRDALCNDTLDIFGFLQTEALHLAGDALAHFSHWITPEILPKRFDTHFFIGHAPDKQLAEHDGGESVDSMWIRPEQLLEVAAAGRATVIFPTRCNLMMLAESRSVEEAMRKSRERTIIPVLPTFEDQDGDTYLCIPEEAGYTLCREKMN